jgi:hypothetical protein
MPLSNSTVWISVETWIHEMMFIACVLCSSECSSLIVLIPTHSSKQILCRWCWIASNPFMKQTSSTMLVRFFSSLRMTLQTLLHCHLGTTTVLLQIEWERPRIVDLAQVHHMASKLPDIARTCADESHIHFREVRYKANYIQPWATLAKELDLTECLILIRDGIYVGGTRRRSCPGMLSSWRSIATSRRSRSPFSKKDVTWRI